MSKEEFIKEIEECEQKLKDLKETLVKEYNDFDTWVKYGVKEDYPYMIDKNKAPLIRKYFIEESYWDRLQTLYLEDILDKLDDDMECDDVPSKEEIELIKQELRDLNFGSMVYDW